MLDVVIRGGTVVDGTGSPARPADVGIRGGRIVAIGSVDERATRVIDADDLIVAPGFVDPHTHYDAQILWDGAATPSCFHGVTTVIGGNCGFSVAPLGAGDVDYLRRLLARVEGMPLAALEAGLAWDWRSTADYLDRIEGSTAVNAGFLVGHSALRRTVMGPDAVGSTAGPQQIAAMRELLGASLAAGGLGFSSSHNTAHTDGDARPVPSRAADRHELLALASTVADHPGTTLEFITAGCLNELSEDELELMADLSVAGHRPLNWNVLTLNPSRPDLAEHQLGASDRARARGGEVVALMMPGGGSLRLSFLTYCALNLLPDWSSVLELPVPERIAKLRDPDVRRWLVARATTAQGPIRSLAQVGHFRIGQTHDPANSRHAGRLVGDIAREQQRDAHDVLFDIVVADDLRTHLWPETAPDTEAIWELRARFLRDRRTLLGGSDAGAHLDRMCGARYPTELLAEGVRRFGALSLEEAVRMLTAEPARLLGLRDRGTVVAGAHADLVVFDARTVAPLPIHEVADLPGGCGRLTSEAIGIEHVLVAGTGIVEDGILTGARPGTVLRSGRDTDTVSPPPPGG
jgi:N-acyl-D-aspartate/D-glutamate deacylase